MGQEASQEGVMENCHTSTQELEPETEPVPVPVPVAEPEPELESSETPGQGFVWQVFCSSGL